MTRCRGELIRIFSNALHGIHQKQKCVTVVTASREGGRQHGDKSATCHPHLLLYHLATGQALYYLDGMNISFHYV